MTPLRRVRSFVIVGATTAVLAGLGAAAAAAACAPRTAVLERISVTSQERQSEGAASRFVKLSADGRLVVFTSPATDLVPGDTNDEQDVFVRDRRAGTTTRVSVDSAGRQADGGSSEASISADGRFVVFTSAAGNLVRGDTNEEVDVFVRDLRRHTTKRVSLTGSGKQAGGSSFLASISATGRFVAFQSTAADLVAGDTNDAEDVFVRDVVEQTTRRASIPSGGRQFSGPSALPIVSDNGRYVAFISNPRNPDVFDVYRRDLRTGSTRLMSVGLRGGPIDGVTGQIAMSGNGRFVGYASDSTNLVAEDTNDQWDTFVYDAVKRTTIRVSVGSDGAQGNGFSDQPSLSRTGRYVAFASEATNLVGGDTNGVGDAFVRDLRTGITKRISTTAAGVQANDTSGPSYAPEIGLSADGRHAAFVSQATNLVRGDTNAAPDLFAWDGGRRR
jgi:Tol biopolymer transport system component